ncbi:MAG: hypothetical protein ACLR8Y_16630 [Alistipes indistinctus]
MPEELYVYDEYLSGVPISGRPFGVGRRRNAGTACRPALRGRGPGGALLLAGRFDRMALWLLLQPYAHGDIKPDNILVEPSGELRLIDLDGMFLPQFAGERSVVLGSPTCQHSCATSVVSTGISTTIRWRSCRSACMRLLPLPGFMTGITIGRT